MPLAQLCQGGRPGTVDTAILYPLKATFDQGYIYIPCKKRLTFFNRALPSYSVDFAQQNPRFQGGGTPQVIYPPRMSLSSASTMQGQLRPQQQFYQGPVQIPQARMGIQAFPPAPVGGYMQSAFVSANQPVVRHDMIMQPGYPAPYVPAAPHGNSTPYSITGYSVPYMGGTLPQQVVYVHGSRQSMMVPQATQQSQTLQQSQPQPGPTQPTAPSSTQAPTDNRSSRSRVEVVLRDPKDNRDVTSEILKRPSQGGSGPGIHSSPLSAEEKSKKEEKDRIVAQFAAQVAVLAGEPQSIQEGNTNVNESETSGKVRSGEKSKTHEKVNKSPVEHVPRILTKQSDTVGLIKVPTEGVVEKKTESPGHNDDATASPCNTMEDRTKNETISELVEASAGHDMEDKDIKAPQDVPTNVGLSETSKSPEEEETRKEDLQSATSVKEENEVNDATELDSNSILQAEPTESVVKHDVSMRKDVDVDSKSGKEVEDDIVIETATDPFSKEDEEPISSSKTAADSKQPVTASDLTPNEDTPSPTHPDVVENVTQDDNAVTTMTTEIVAGATPHIPKAAEELSESTSTSAEDDEVAKSIVTESAKGSESVPSSENESQSADDRNTKLLNGHDQPNQQGSAFSQVPKKKKQKQRFKEMSAKGDKSDLDLMSAYVDKPPKEESLELEESKPQEVDLDKEVEKPEEEEATWEDKEHEIEKESEKQVSPKVAATTIISSEDGNVNENTKLQYDRDFLLKFQFASICTEKPKDLPNIEIVLNRAHEPTKLIPAGQGTRGQYNDFTPHYLKHAGGGRQASLSGRGGKGGRGMVAMPKKIITTSFESKVELKKSENAWVRPTKAADSLPEEERSKDELYRAVRGILNKLTPQKFDTLVKKMLDLVIDSPEKLDGVIDLIFQKAIAEPGFSVAYANMCKVLAQNQQSGSGEGKDWPTNFRRILLNKCQKEFQKEKADEKTLMADREKEFEKPEEKKAWMEELELKEQKQRRKTLGNIRFIGELFKLRMLKETIMHECIMKLLTSGDEDSTECLCKLLTTIGVDLDHEAAKPLLKQYFEQMEKMTKQKKLSSRVKFMLQDVIELRGNKWVPRREGEGPKTIDQIHEEAKIKEQKVQLAIQEDARQRKLQGGRDSPNVRTSVPTSEDGWSVAGKSRPQQLDPNKLRLTKRTDSDTISLGPGGRTGSSWARGAGMGLSRTTATDDHKQENNRFSALSDQSSRGYDSKGKGPLRSLGSRRVPESRGSAQSQRAFSRDTQSDNRGERDKALAAARQLNTRTSRTPSPSVRLEEDRSSQTSSGPRTPSDSPAPTPPPPPNVDVIKEKIRKEAKQTVDEYIYTRDANEAAQCVKDLNASLHLAAFVSEAINHVLETKGEARKQVGKLLHFLVNGGVMSVDSVIEGLNEVLEFAEDLATDIPYIWSYLGEIIGNFVYDGTVPLNRLKESVEPLIPGNKAGRLMAEILSVAVKTSSEEQVAQQWHQSGLTWESLLRPDEDVAQFIKDKKMEFIDTAKKQSPTTHASQIQEELRKLLQTKEEETDTEKIMSWIKSNISETERSGTTFIRSLATEVCNHNIEKDGTRYVFNKDKFAKGGSSNLLMKYVERNADRELQVLFAVQKLFVDLDQPTDVLLNIFTALYIEEIISDDSVYKWEQSDEEPHGKRAALSQLQGFLEWLKSLDDDNKAQES